LILQADGALQQKLDAYVDVNRYYADAIKGYQGNWVSTVNMGGSKDGGSMNGAQALIEMFAAKTAKELALDMEIQGQK
jgi:hypothetical protein